MSESTPKTTATAIDLRVFANASGGHGNPLWVLEGAPDSSAERMLSITGGLGYSETMLFDVGDQARVRIFNPVEELPFAGHPMVGAGWLLTAESDGPAQIICPAGACEVASEGDLTWITARTEWAPRWQSVQFETAAEVDQLSGPPPGHDFVQAWAWLDEAAGRVRARVFAPRAGIPEDEACGSASLLLADRLGREIAIEHGLGSLVHARPLTAGVAQVGGRVVLASRRPYLFAGS